MLPERGKLVSKTFSCASPAVQSRKDNSSVWFSSALSVLSCDFNLCKTCSKVYSLGKSSADVGYYALFASTILKF